MHDEELIETDSKSILEEKLTELIAQALGVSPDDITPEFIHKWREEHIYPNARYDFSSRYGGYNSARRIVLSRAEIESHRKQAEAFLAQFVVK
jgi:hypothetical protein